ncbi:transposase, partial [Rhodomicrobium sp. Az07]|uniref:transposase n=1 Tax=Rhodomicrobium sp. Az07 TaxID=2839034 RepID=UPI001BE5B9BE
SDVARRHGLRPQQLFNWRNEFRKRKTGLVFGTPAFAPVMIADDPPTAPAEAAKAAAPVAEAPLIEIVLGGATVRTRGAIDTKALAGCFAR